MEQASHPGAVWRTWANGLTLLRALLALPTAFWILHGDLLPAAICFATAVITDALDGPLARRLGQASPVGGLFDHATDALFVTAVLTAAAIDGRVVWVLPVIVPLAFLQYVLDSFALQGRPLRANRLGRLNGIAYFLLAGAAVLLPLAAQDSPAFDTAATAIIHWASIVLVATSVCSMIDRARWRQTG